jgi:hypothetical protein
MSSSTKSLFESTVTLFDALLPLYIIQYHGFFARVLVDFELGRFWTWGDILGFTGIELGDDGEPETQADHQIRDHILSIKSALQSVSALRC